MDDPYVLRGPKFKHPVPKTSLGDFFFEYGDKFKNQICQIDGSTNESETYFSVIQRSVRTALALKERRICQNDVITLCCSNILDTIIPILAGFYLGAKVSNLEPSLSVRHTKYLLCLVKPKIIFVEKAALHLIEDSLIGVDFESEIVVFGKTEKYTCFSEFTKERQDEDEFKPAKVDPDDVAVMFFSSGPTGLPKTICHSHYSFLMIANQMFFIGIKEAILHFNSFYWISAMLLLTCSFKHGTYRIFLRSTFTTEDVFKIIEKHKIGCIFTDPVLTYSLTNFPKPSQYDTSSLKVIFCDGSTMPASQFQQMSDLFRTAFISLLYETSEAGICTVFCPQHHRDLVKYKLSSSGKVAPEMQLKISDLDTGKTLPAYQKGEIRLKSSFLMKGYYTSDSSVAYDDDGFCKSRDIGYYDEDGCVYVMGKIRETFIYQSWHIIPSLIENVLLELPDVKEAVVVGVPWGEDGEAPAAVIVLHNNCNLREKEIDDFLRKRVATVERLRGGIVFLESLPRTSIGRVVKTEVLDIVARILRKNKEEFLYSSVLFHKSNN